MAFALPYRNVAIDDDRREHKLTANDFAVREVVPEATDDDSALYLALKALPLPQLLVMYVALDTMEDYSATRYAVEGVLVDVHDFLLSDLTDFAPGSPQN